MRTSLRRPCEYPLASASVFLWRAWDVTLGLMRVIGYVAYGISRRMRFKSRGETGIISSYSRAARFDRLRRKWLLPCRVRTSLPDPVYSNRRAAALCVFNFGINRGASKSTIDAFVTLHLVEMRATLLYVWLRGHAALLSLVAVAA